MFSLSSAFEKVTTKQEQILKSIFNNYKMCKNLFAKIICAVIVFVVILMTNAKASVLIEDDILVGMDYFESVRSQTSKTGRGKRAATARKERIWNFAVVPYEIDPNFSGDEKAGFKEAMKHWENFTCIKFVERNASEHENFIRFTELPCGCCSHVGMEGNGGQNVSIGKDCHKIGVIVHELGHAIGFWHEHTRPDRDQYVTIYSENIQIGQEHNFNKLTSEDVDSLGEPYDHKSIMHYGRKIYSRNDYDPTISAKKNGRITPKIGQREHLSLSDIRQTNKLYKCAGCGRTFLGQQASFTSPDYNGKALAASGQYRCEWRIAVTHGERIHLNITDLEIFASTDCQSDYLEIRDGYWHKSMLLGRFCGTKMDIPTIISTGDRMILTYVSQHPSHRGFAANYEAICGGNLTIVNGQKIESPNHPQFYSPNKECIWRITVPTNYQVALEFSTMDLELHSNCRRDFIEVRDGDNERSRLIGRYCGNVLPPVLATTSNRMFIRFVSDKSGQRKGFSASLYQEIDECELKEHGCEQSCINILNGYSCACRLGYKLRSDMKTCEVTCGGIINATNGIIESPSFPNLYPPNEKCIWEIVSHEPYRIMLNFTHFELEGSHLVHDQCDYDSVMISSKYRNGTFSHQGVFCSELLPPTITSRTSVMHIQFQSDKTVQKAGFHAVFSTIIDRCAIKNGGCKHLCRNTFDSVECACRSGFILAPNGFDCIPGRCRYEITAPEGEIKSENYPKNYPKNSDCIWHFKSIHGHRPYVKFLKFDIEDGYECSNDIVQPYIKVDPAKRFFATGDTLTLGRFCGSNLPPPVESPSDGMYLAFKTDSSGQRQGFIAKHSTVCGGNFIATNEIKYIYSHARFGDTFYDHNTDCDWNIMAKEPGQRIHFTVVDFDVEDHESCSYDFVELYELQNENKQKNEDWILHGKFCGSNLQLEVVASGRLLLQFRTDETVRRKGFSVSYVVANSTTIRNFDSGSSRYNLPRNI